MRIKSASTLLFVGDSITDCGRQRDSSARDLGGGYVAQVQALIGAHHPQARLRILNSGISGNRVTDLERRWERDVLAHRPDWVSLLIGINDVWRQFDDPFADQVSERAYSAKLANLIERTVPLVEGMLVLSPFFLETNPADPMRAMMDRYGAAAKAVAERKGVHFVDLQAAFDRWLVDNPTQLLCADRVHPNAVGHQIIASAFLNAVGFKW